MKNLLCIHMLAFSALLMGCGPSRDEITAACVEISETRGMDGAPRIRILRELEVPADELEAVHSRLESRFRRGEGVSRCRQYLNAQLGSRIPFDFSRDDGAKPEMVNIVVADKDIDPGVEITESDIRLLTMPRDLAPPGAITGIDQLDDLVPANAIERGEILLTSKLIAKTDHDSNSANETKSEV